MTTTLDDRHPQFTARQPDWEVMADTYEGERCVKSKGKTYLPATSGMLAQGFDKAGSNPETNLGLRAYEAYRTRAVFHPFVKDAIDGLVGMVHRKPPTIEVPKVLEPMVEHASVLGEHICQVWRRITEHQLLMGGYGLLVDVPTGLEVDEATPYLATYSRMAIPNWDSGVRSQGLQELELVVLDESGYERGEDLRRVWVNQYRILARRQAVDTVGESDQQAPAKGVYMVGVVRMETGTQVQSGQQPIDLRAAKWIQPSLGGVTLDQIPFVFVNTNDLAPEPCSPPLLGLANLCLAIYRGEADYRHSLYMTGQDTLVRTGATEDQQQNMTGAGAILDVPMGGDAKYIGVTGVGLTEQREALENDKEQAAIYAIKMLDRQTGDAESGEALRVRVTARTATLVSLQKAAAQGIKDALTFAGKWMGLSDDELEKIVVEPNLDFTDDAPTAADLDVLMSAKQKGLPLSMESIHAYLKGHEFTTMEYEDELKAIEEEQTTLGTMGQAAEDLDPFADDTEQAYDENGDPVDTPVTPPGGDGGGKNGKGKKPPPFLKKKKETAPPA